MQTKRSILIYGFSKKFSSTLQAKLIEKGFSVSIFYSDNFRINILFKKRFDVLLIHNVDSNLFNVTGKRLKKEGVKIVYVTDSRKQREVFMKNIDEIVKAPYNIDEIIWAVSKLFTQRNYLTVGDIAKLNYPEKEIIINGVRIELTYYETEILYLLIDANRIVSGAEFCRYLSILYGKGISLRYISTIISRLRLKIRKITGLELVKTRRRVGYYCSIK